MNTFTKVPAFKKFHINKKSPSLITVPILLLNYLHWFNIRWSKFVCHRPINGIVFKPWHVIMTIADDITSPCDIISNWDCLILKWLANDWTLFTSFWKKRSLNYIENSLKFWSIRLRISEKKATFPRYYMRISYQVQTLC